VSYVVGEVVGWHPRSWRGGIKWNFHLWKLYRDLCLCGEEDGKEVESSKSSVATGGKWMGRLEASL
jgi:hypothetical protein